ncbi:type II toxin-antitoxin system HicA family toxin [Candidatus Woesebacteria bacterium]|nr:type II toxin-antitoxin system HicA family toxin [Candidatus Woesebacteria bacterium]
MTAKKLLKKYDMYIHHERGSHIILKSYIDSSVRVTIPMHNKNLKRKTTKSILKQSGLPLSFLTK